MSIFRHSDYLEVAIQAASKAGEVLVAEFGKKHLANFKTTHDIGLEVDKCSEKVILGIISSNYPSHNIYIESYKKHFPKAKVILATNATTRLNQDLKNQGLDNMFDGILNSSELGCAKPSRRFFNQALDKLGIGVDEVIYIDDSIKNVQSARQLGIRSHHYQDHTQLVEFLLDAKKIYFSNSDI